MENKNTLNIKEEKLIVKVFENHLNSIKNLNSDLISELYISSYKVDEKEHTRFFDFKIIYNFKRHNLPGEELTQKVSKFITEIYQFMKVIEFLPNTSGKNNYFTCDLQRAS